jgi:hypothetical protein
VFAAAFVTGADVASVVGVASVALVHLPQRFEFTFCVDPMEVYRVRRVMGRILRSFACTMLC